MKTLSVSAEPDFPLSAYGSEKVAAPQGDLCQEKYKFPDAFRTEQKELAKPLASSFHVRNSIPNTQNMRKSRCQKRYTFSDTFGQTSH